MCCPVSVIFNSFYLLEKVVNFNYIYCCIYEHMEQLCPCQFQIGFCWCFIDPQQRDTAVSGQHGSESW